MKIVLHLVAILVLMLSPVLAKAQDEGAIHMCNVVIESNANNDDIAYQMLQSKGLDAEDVYLESFGESLDSARSYCPGANPYELAAKKFMPRSTDLYQKLKQQQAANERSAGQAYGIK